MDHLRSEPNTSSASKKFACAYRCTLSWDSWIQSTPSLSRVGLPSDFISSVYAKCSAHLVLLDLITLIIFGEEWNRIYYVNMHYFLCSLNSLLEMAHLSYRRHSRWVSYMEAIWS